MKFLLDSHISKATVPALRKRCPGVQVEHLAEWQGGKYLDCEDHEILAACFEEMRTFVTFDLRTVPSLLRQWAAEDLPHAGVVFGDADTIKPHDSGRIAASLALLAREYGSADLLHVIRFLPRV